MSYFAGNMKKLKFHMLKGMQIHNQRERESQTNRDIDKSRTVENYDLVNAGKIDYKAKIEQRIKEGVKGNRKIRRDAVVCNTWVITSDKSFFDRIGKAEEERFFKEAYKWFSERYGKENVAYAMVHRDEHTPHMHLGVVPIKEGRLTSKELFNKKELQAVQAEFPMYIQKKGFDLQRGVPSKQKHMEPVRYKNKQLIEQYMDTVMKLEEKLEELGKVEERERDIDKIETKEGGLLNRGKVIVSKEDWEYIKGKAKQAISLKMELEKSEQGKDWILERNRMLEDSTKKYNQLANFLGKDEVDKLVEDTVGRILGKDLSQEKGLDRER
jgi:hypothetical protein